MPDFLAGDAAKAGKLVPVLPQWRPKKHKLWKYYIVYAGRRYALPKVEAFVQTALEQSNGIDIPYDSSSALSHEQTFTVQ